MNKRRGGFTIVELLIVIVVIGILAAITVVAYNGIQLRAQNAKALTAIDSYEKALRAYKAENGEYPAVPVGLYCLGLYPSDSVFVEDECLSTRQGSSKITSYFNHYVVGGINHEVNGLLSTSLISLPNAVFPTSSQKNAQGAPGIGISRNSRGIIYAITDKNSDTSFIELDPGIHLFYTIDGNQECGRGVKTKLIPFKDASDDYTYTVCVLTLE